MSLGAREEIELRDLLIEGLAILFFVGAGIGVLIYLHSRELL